MLDKPIAIPRRVLEDYIGSTIESAWDTILVTLGTEETMGKESEWKNVQWVAHTDKEAMEWIHLQPSIWVNSYFKPCLAL